MSEINSARKRLSSGGEGEANDEGTETTSGGYRGAVSQSQEEKDKGAILNEFVEATGFARSYAVLVLLNQGRGCG